MTEKKFIKLVEKIKANDTEVFDNYEDAFGPIDTASLYQIVKDYEYDNLGELILSAVYDAISDEADFYDLIKSKVTNNENDDESGDAQSSGPSVIKSYFDDIKKVYDKYDNSFKINFQTDPVEKIISLNTKTVITIAKRYQGYGLGLEELIGAGNIGLCLAAQKFDPARNTVKDNIISACGCLGKTFAWSDLEEATRQVLSYGDVYKKFVSAFSKKKKITRDELNNWIDSNIKPASFNSVASFWITAEIKKALSNHTKGVEIKDDNYEYIQEEIKEIKEKIAKCKSSEKLRTLQGQLDWLNETADKVKPTIANNVRIDAPVSGTNINQGGDMDLNNVIQSPEMEENEELEFEKVTDKNRFYDIIEKLFENVKQRDKRVFMKSYGINYPGKISAADISLQEGISVARVSQIVNSTLDTIKDNIQRYNVDKDYLYSLIS